MNLLIFINIILFRTLFLQFFEEYMFKVESKTIKLFVLEHNCW